MGAGFAANMSKGQQHKAFEWVQALLPPFQRANNTKHLNLLPPFPKGRQHKAFVWVQSPCPVLCQSMSKAYFSILLQTEWVQALLPTSLQRHGCLKLAGVGSRPPWYHLQAVQPRQLQTMTPVAFFCWEADGETQARQPPLHMQVYHSCRQSPGRSAIYSCTVRIES